MREGIERSLPSIRAMSRVAYTTKLQRWDRSMEESIIDACAATGDFIEDALSFSFGAERIDTKRGAVDFIRDPDGLVEVLDWEDRHQWAEGLIPDEGIVGGIDDDDGQLDEVL